jgi:hypothetical protein
MKQIKFTTNDFVENSTDDAVLDPNDPIYEMMHLAGIRPVTNADQKFSEGSNISKTAAEKAALMKKHKIKPGTDAWFKLWFSLPYLTGEKPIDK